LGLVMLINRVRALGAHRGAKSLPQASAHHHPTAGVNVGGRGSHWKVRILCSTARACASCSTEMAPIRLQSPLQPASSSASSATTTAPCVPRSQRSASMRGIASVGESGRGQRQRWRDSRHVQSGGFLGGGERCPFEPSKAGLSHTGSSHARGCHCAPAQAQAELPTPRVEKRTGGRGALEQIDASHDIVSIDPWAHCQRLSKPVRANPGERGGLPPAPERRMSTAASSRGTPRCAAHPHAEAAHWHDTAPLDGATRSMGRAGAT
jgi:hypothetical protein